MPVTYCKIFFNVVNVLHKFIFLVLVFISFVFRLFFFTEKEEVDTSFCMRPLFYLVVLSLGIKEKKCGEESVQQMRERNFKGS